MLQKFALKIQTGSSNAVSTQTIFASLVGIVVDVTGNNYFVLCNFNFLLLQTYAPKEILQRHVVN